MEGNNSNDSVYLAVNLDKPDTKVINIYIEAEKRLAELISGKEVHANEQGAVWILTDKGILAWANDFPPWARDSTAAFALMVEHGFYPTEGKHNETELIWIFDGLRCLAEAKVADHSSKDAAVRYVIVKAAIAKLESGINPDSPQAT